LEIRGEELAALGTRESRVLRTANLTSIILGMLSIVAFVAAMLLGIISAK
jgi:hypothetical protein